jgi:hypothetical protein
MNHVNYEELVLTIKTTPPVLLYEIQNIWVLLSTFRLKPHIYFLFIFVIV